MATVRVTDALLRRLCDINQFEIPKDVEMIFFGIRGSLPFNTENYKFEDSRTIRMTEINYTSFNCTMGQWMPKTGKLTVFAASTVPGLKNIQGAMKKGGEGTNQMIPGFYTDIKKGWHQGGQAKFGHEAFRQQEERPVRRTANDAQYDDNDLITYEVQHDNVHSGFRKSVDDNINATYGCQVLMGLPKCEVYSAFGPWKAFKDAGYAAKQDYFPYLLLNSRDYLRVYEKFDDPHARKLRYGSTGELVKKLQQILIDKKLDAKEAVKITQTGKIDIPTFKAIIALQKQNKEVADGIVGKGTAALLGIDLGDSTPMKK